MSRRWTKEERANWIYYLMRPLKITAADIGRKMEPPRTPSMVQQVIRGVKISRPVQKAVAEALGMKYGELWGKSPSTQPSPARGEET